MDTEYDFTRATDRQLEQAIKEITREIDFQEQLNSGRKHRRAAYQDELARRQKLAELRETIDKKPGND